MSVRIVITSGKGGVGKTTTTASIGVGLAQRGYKVVVMDIDTGLRNLDLLLGLENRIMYDLVDVTREKDPIPYKKALVRHRKYETLFLLPTSQVKNKDAINPDQVEKLCKEMDKDFDYILLDSPAGIEEGFKTAIKPAQRAIIVTTPEITAVRDADKVIGELGREGINDIKLIVTRLRPKMIEEGDMFDMRDINDLLAIECIGQIPEDEAVIKATNRGEPVITMENSMAGKAYKNVVGRLFGEQIPFYKPPKESFLTRLKKLFGIL